MATFFDSEIDFETGYWAEIVIGNLRKRKCTNLNSIKIGTASVSLNQRSVVEHLLQMPVNNYLMQGNHLLLLACTPKSPSQFHENMKI